MPQAFKGAVLTNKGAALLNRAQAGIVKMKFTRLAVGNGVYTEEEKEISAMQEMTGLKSEQNSYGLSSVKVDTEHSVEVTALITNYDVTTDVTVVQRGYYINEMGLIAQGVSITENGEEVTEPEVLYSITVTAGEQGDYMPPYNGRDPAQILQRYYATVSNSAEVYINAQGAAALASDVIRLSAQVQWLYKMLCQYRYDPQAEAIISMVPHECVDDVLHFPEGMAHLTDDTIVLAPQIEEFDYSVPENGGLSNGTGNAYILPVADANTLGGVKIGSGIKRLADGTISVDTSGVAESVSGQVAESAAEKAAEIMEANATEPSNEDIDGLFR